jgi:outer membrane protein assembly factor BamB
MRRILPVGLLILVAAATEIGTGAQAPSPSSSSWPGFRGPDRDGVYRGSIRTSWEGLAPMWKKPIGGGRASFAVAGGRAFTIEQRQRQEVVAAYDVMTGKTLWTNAWDARFKSAFMGIMGGGEGPRATPAFADGLVYALGGRGELRCLDAATGKLVWRTNILQDAGASNLSWGMAGSPLIAGDAVIVQPGGPKGRSVAAYDRRTGKPLWTALDDKTAYVSPMQITLGGVPQLVIVTAKRLVGLSLDRRDVLWEFPWSTDHDASAAQPIVIGDNRIFYSSGYGTGAVVIELTRTGDTFSVRQVWRNIRMKNRQSTSILHEGFIYGLDDGILACLDAATGELKWKGGRYGHGQMLLAGGHLVVTTEEGELVLVSAVPGKLTELARVPAVDGETWNVPAFADGILLVRNTREMAAFDLRPDAKYVADSDGLAQQAPAPATPATKAAEPGRGFFASWGYNGDGFAKSDLHVSQPSLGNDFTFVGVQARDSKTWTDLFNHYPFVPQYNVRFGFFFNERWGLEVALDHIKWIVKEDQQVRMTGTLDGAAVDTPVTLTPDVLVYQLNNGSNPLFVNLVRRIRLAGEPGRTGYFALLAKAGGGVAFPHTENTVFGQPNEKGFQFFHGWDLDAAAAVRVHIWKPVYFEFEGKLVYARYFDVKIDRGTARHSVKAAEYNWNFGVAFK